MHVILRDINRRSILINKIRNINKNKKNILIVRELSSNQYYRTRIYIFVNGGLFPVLFFSFYIHGRQTRRDIEIDIDFFRYRDGF